jgi:hypothetical protein
VALGFGRSEDVDVVSLIAARRYGQAIEILREQLRRRGASTTVRKQLADVLVLSGKTIEAVSLLLPMADKFAREGFAAKAVSILKRIEKIDPGRGDVEERLARLIEEKQRQAAVVLPTPHSAFEIGIEEIIGPPAKVDVSEATPPLPSPAPVDDDAEGVGTGALPTQADDDIADYDLLYVPADEDAEEDEPPSEAAAASAGPTLSESGFADELMSLVDSVFQESPGAGLDTAAVAGASRKPRPGGGQIVVSPLFRDFSVDEMVAVIHGLRLLTFERGQVILREGEPGASLYMLTSGRVRAFRKDRQSGKQARIGDLEEGAFFGEMSILSGQPRAASIVALTSCELLELDRPTLDGITAAHPHVWDVLREFAEARSQGAH